MRPDENRGRSAGRPLLLYTLPQLFGAEDKLVAVNRRQLVDCQAESTPKGEYPCDTEVFQLCCILMVENDWDAPTTGYEAAELYRLLRDIIYTEML